MAASGLQIVFGGACIQKTRGFPDKAATAELLDELERLGITKIDTAQTYGESEELLGLTGASSRFTIDTKAAMGFRPGFCGDREGMLREGRASLKRLGLEKVDIFYLHSPEATVPLEDTLAGVNDLYKTGAFQRFGLSNYVVEDVQRVYDICTANGYVRPSVYQGNYNPVARRQEQLLFPTLRRLNMSFYAYSPLGGGFLTKTPQQIMDGEGRFDQNKPVGRMYYKMYSPLLSALGTWAAIASDLGISPAELAYRWVSFNSPLENDRGDALIIGARNLSQLRETVEWLKKGPLDEKTSQRIDDMWESIKDAAPLDNFNG